MFLNFVTYLLISLYTIWFVAGTSWFTISFSMLGNMIGRSEEFVLWGLTVGIYLFWCLRWIARRVETKPKGTFLAPMSLVLLTFALTTPYLLEALPLKSFLYIVSAFVAAVYLVLCLCLTAWRPYQGDRETCRIYLKSLIAVACFSAFLPVLVRIIGNALEIFFIISTVVLVRSLLRRVGSDT